MYTRGNYWFSSLENALLAQLNGIDDLFKQLNIGSPNSHQVELSNLEIPISDFDGVLILHQGC